jgi:hypothetical protein
MGADDRALPVHAAPAALLAALLSLPVHAADIVIVNNDPAGVGFNDSTPVSPVGLNPGTTLGQQRLFAVQFIADQWAALLQSEIDIVVQAQWPSLTCTTNSAVLGSAGPVSVHGNFEPGILLNTWYPVALANSLTSAPAEDLNDSQPEISLNINVELDEGTGCLGGRSWYYGLDENFDPFSEVDLVPLVLHELGHGLGFVSLVNLSEPTEKGDPPAGALLQGFPDVFTNHLRDVETGEDWVDMTDAERVASSTNDPDVVWTGPAVNAMAAAFVTAADAFSAGFLRMHAPSPFEPGSSISHWATSETSLQDWLLLMEPSLSLALFDQVDVTIDAMVDIGWRTRVDLIFADGFEP